MFTLICPWEPARDTEFDRNTVTYLKSHFFNEKVML